MRYTKAFIEARAQRAMEACNMDCAGNVWSRNAEGKNVSRVGATFVSRSYYGWSLSQMCNEQGGERQLIGSRSAREFVSALDGMLLAATGERSNG